MGSPWRQLAQGILGCGLHPQRYAWTPDDLESFESEETFPQARPENRAWLALSRRALPAARLALQEFRIAMEHQARKEAAAQTDVQLNAILSSPGEVLRIELRALEALVDG